MKTEYSQRPRRGQYSFTRRHLKVAGPGWQREDLFEVRDPKPGEDYDPEESLLLFGDVLGTGTVASERSASLPNQNL